MIESQERIIRLCEKKGIAVSQLEKDIKASNGYIKATRIREFPTDRLSKIADILGVTTDYLMYGEDNYRAKQNRDFLAAQLELLDAQLGTAGRKILTPSDFKAAFYGNDPDLTAEDADELWEDAISYIEFKKEQRKRKKDECGKAMPVR